MSSRPGIASEGNQAGSLNVGWMGDCGLRLCVDSERRRPRKRRTGGPSNEAGANLDRIDALVLGSRFGVDEIPQTVDVHDPGVRLSDGHPNERPTVDLRARDIRVSRRVDRVDEPVCRLISVAMAE